MVYHGLSLYILLDLPGAQQLSLYQPQPTLLQQQQALLQQQQQQLPVGTLLQNIKKIEWCIRHLERRVVGKGFTV